MGLVEAQPKTFSVFTSPLRGSRPVFFTRTRPSSPTFSMAALLADTVSVDRSTLEAFSAPETLVYMGPKHTRLTISAAAARKATTAEPRTSSLAPFFTLTAAASTTIRTTRAARMA